MIKKIIKYCHNSLSRILHRHNVSYGAIIMLHRIDKPDENGIWYNEHLKMSPYIIEKMAEYARSRGCEFVSVEEIVRPRRFWEQPRKLIAVTLDDGYRDNYLYGSPTFVKLNIPYCIYVCTKMVESNMLYWWEILEQLCVNESIINLRLLDGSEKSIDCSTKQKKEQAFLAIREIILKLPQVNLLEQLEVLFSKYDIDYNYGNGLLGLTWEQIRELMKDPLCTIGNHTYSHDAFTGCTDDAIKSDIARAANIMKEKTGFEMSHFAFPFGEASAVSKHDIELVKNFGFKTSATTKDGLICYGTDALELPRLFVTEKNWKQVIDRIVNCC